jgi:DtxR family Mn-dependent transcriptional regulator
MIDQPIVGESVEMYLKSIYELQQLESPVLISLLARRMGVSSPAAVEMVKRLAKKGWVEHIPYKGVQLTERGRKRAINVIRRHRLWERFLQDNLGLPWEKIHNYACRLEHTTAPEVADALEAFLGFPQTCPHGNPIPDKEGRIDEVAVLPLSQIEPDQKVRVHHIAYEEEILLDYLAKRQIFPGIVLVLDEIEPYQGPLMLRVRNGEEERSVVLGREIASRIFVAIEE